MDYKGILFDFDGVVIDSMHQHYAAWSKAFSKQGITISKQEFFLLEGQGIETIAQILGTAHGLDHQQYLDILSEKVRYYYKSEIVKFYDYFLEMLERLKEKNIPMAVVTGGNRDRVEKTIDDYLQGYFKTLVTVDDVVNGKPHPEPFLKGAEFLGLKPQQCVVVENAPHGIKAAKKAGCFVIAIKTTLDNKLLAEADWICEDFICVEKKLINIFKF